MYPKKIIAALEASGTTRYKIALDTGISQGTLSRIMAGDDTRATSIQTAIKLAEFAKAKGIGLDGEKIKKPRK